MTLPSINLTGNLVKDPELRYTQGGHAVCRLRVASTERRLNRETQQWEDGRQCFLDIEIWRDQAENVMETLTRGMHIAVSGKLHQREYETKEGEKRTVYEVVDPDVSVLLQRQTAKVERTARNGAGQPAPATAPATAPAATPAATPAGQPAAAGAPAGAGFFEPPF